MENIAQRMQTRARRLFIQGEDGAALAMIHGLADCGRLTHEMLLLRSLALAEQGCVAEARLLLQRTVEAIQRSLEHSQDFSRAHRKRIQNAIAAADRWLTTAGRKPRTAGERTAVTIDIVHADPAFEVMEGLGPRA